MIRTGKHTTYQLPNRAFFQLIEDVYLRITPSFAIPTCDSPSTQNAHDLQSKEFVRFIVR
jgi:hypothetical protein